MIAPAAHFDLHFFYFNAWHFGHALKHLFKLLASNKELAFVLPRVRGCNAPVGCFDHASSYAIVGHSNDQVFAIERLVQPFEYRIHFCYETSNSVSCTFFLSSLAQPTDSRL